MVDYNPFSAEIMEDPYPTYRRLRAEAPVYRLADYPCWALSRLTAPFATNRSSAPSWS